MPVLHLTCPHCDKDVELSVTSVTLSRQCPACAAKIILQVPGASSQKHLVRSSILVASAEEKPIVSPPASEPQMLEGDVLKRMLHDPQVKNKASALVWGLVVVCAMIALLVAGAYFDLAGKIHTAYVKARTPKRLVEETTPFSVKHFEISQGPESIAAAKAAALAVLGEGNPAVSSTVIPAQTNPPTSLEPELQDAPQKRALIEFLQASSIEERLKHVRDHALLERAIRSYYATHPSGAIAFDSVEEGTQNQDAALPSGMTRYSVILTTGEHRRALVEPGEGGGYVVDWASFVLYGPMEWDSFHKERPAQPVLFRVLASSDAYFEGKFLQGAGLVCVKLVDPRRLSGEAMYGYASTTSEAGHRLLSTMGRAHGQSLPITVTLNYPAVPSSSDQVWIAEFVADGWYCHGR